MLSTLPQRKIKALILHIISYILFWMNVSFCYSLKQENRIRNIFLPLGFETETDLMIQAQSLRECNYKASGCSRPICNQSIKSHCTEMSALTQPWWAKIEHTGQFIILSQLPSLELAGSIWVQKGFHSEWCLQLKENYPKSISHCCSFL